MRVFKIFFLGLFCFAPIITAAQKNITGVVVQDILENKWSAIVIEVNGRRYGVQTAFYASAGDNMDGIKGWITPTTGNISKGRTVQVFYSTIDSSFEYEGIKSWLKAVKITETKTTPPTNIIQLRQEISDLRQAILRKIDNDVESTALGFTNSKEILRPLRVAYSFKTVLDTVTSTFGIISDATNVRNIKNSLTGVNSPIEYAGSMLAIHGAYQNGETLAFVFDSNRYSTNVSQMLETADNTQPLFKFNSLTYKNSIKQSLEGGNGTNIIIMPHREPKAFCQIVQPRGVKSLNRTSIKGLLALRRYITDEFQKLENYVGTKTYSPQQINDLISLIRYAKSAVIESKSHSTQFSLTAPTSLVPPNCRPTSTLISLGMIADKQTVLQEAYGALNKGLQFEQLMTVKSAGDGITSATQVFLKDKGGKVQQKVLDVSSKVSLAFDIGNLAKDYIFKPQDPKEIIAEKPQEILMALPDEGTSLLLLTDTLNKIVQQPGTVSKPQQLSLTKDLLKITKPSSDIRRIDFKNFNYGGDNPILRNGHQKLAGSEMNYVDLSSVKYVDFDGDEKEEAFVILNVSTSGSAGSFLDVYVFAYRNGSAQQIWHMNNERSSVVLEGSLILFTSPEYVGDDAHCCPSYATTDTYGWKGLGFTLISKKRKRLK